MIKKYGLISVVIIISSALFFIISFFAVSINTATVIDSSTDSYTTYDTPESDTAFGGIFYDFHWHLNDSLPHYKYKMLEDSLKRIKDQKDFINKSIPNTGMSIGHLGVCSIDKERQLFANDDDKEAIAILDSLQLTKNEAETERWKKRYVERRQTIKEQKEKLYYMALSGYAVENDTKFYIDKGKYRLVYLKIDSTKNNTKHGHYESKEIAVRYRESDKQILVPVTKKAYNILNVCINIIMYGNVVFFACVFLGFPVDILLNISKGNPFRPKNIRLFKLMSLIIIVYMAIVTFFPYVLRLFLGKMIPDDFKLPSLVESITPALFTLLIAAAIFIIGKAFEKGLHLQKEQELTI